MKNLFLLLAAGAFGRAAGQSGDTQGVSMQLTANSSLYDRLAVLNYIQNQEYDDAIAYLAPILKADSGNAGLLGYAGFAYYQTEDYRSAGACYRRLLGLDSNNIPALHYLLLISMNDHPAESMDYPWSRQRHYPCHGGKLSRKSAGVSRCGREARGRTGSKGCRSGQGSRGF